MSSENPDTTPVSLQPWAQLRRFTAARIALGRSGGSQTTPAQLAFNLDHALARDAVHAAFDTAALAAELRALPGAPPVLTLTTAAPDRATFLRRPDLGRQLSPESRAQLSVPGTQLSPGPDLAIIVSDGLSALAAHRQAPALLAEFLPRWRDAGYTLAPLCVVRHARVSLLDEIGVALRARLAVILLGERPGLGTPDSLGAYLEYAPQPGRTNAERNCLSNIRPAGLSHKAAAEKLATLLGAALRLQLSGIGLKEDSPMLAGDAVREL